MSFAQNPNAIPRRFDMQRMTPAELVITKAIEAVEQAGCDPLLTDATCFLAQARGKVADYVDAEAVKDG